MEISRDIGGMRAAIASAVVVLVSPTLLFIAKLNEAQLNQFGCACTVTDPDGLASLLELVAGAGIAAAPAPGRFALDARIGIYLRWHGGHASRLVFDTAGRCGAYNGATAVCAANPQFAQGLRAWAAARLPAFTPPEILPEKKKGLEIAL